MKNLAIYLAAGASALLVTAASAAPLSPNASVAPESNVQNVRMVCNEAGRCWRERGERRVIIREHGDSYGYAPRRERYIERRGYEERSAASASAHPALASESALIATEETDKSLNTRKPRRNPRLFFDAISNGSATVSRTSRLSDMALNLASLHT